MKTDKNTWKGYFFFFLRLISICLAVIVMYLAYDMYNAKKYEKALESAPKEAVQLLQGIFNEIFD